MTKKAEYILLIDDDEASNYFHKMVITKADCAKECVVAESGLEALELLQAQNTLHKPDLVFLDINMPKMNGWEFLIELKKTSPLSNSVILIMLTTSINPDDRKKVENIDEISGYEEKPLTIEKIQAIMRRHFS